MTSSNRRVARAAGVVMAGFIASRALGLLREMIIGGRFGTSAELDAYLAAFRLPDILFQLMAGGALASAFIPTFTTYLARGEEDEAWRLSSAIINLVMLFTGTAAALAALLAPWIVAHVVAPRFPPAQQALTASLMRWMLIAPVVFGVSGVVMGILNSFQHFLLPALAPVMYNLSIIGGALFLAPRIGVRGLVVGVVVGAALHLLVQVPGLVRQGMRYTLELGLNHPGVREVGRLMGPRVLGLAIVQLNFLVNTILASGLPPGSLSALNFAWLLMLLPQGIVAQAVATAAFPTFSDLAARGQLGEMRETLTATLRAVLFLTIPASVGLYVLRVPLIQLLFQRGAFAARSTEAVAWALQFYALGLAAHSGVEILTRAFYALHDTKTPVLVGGGAMALNVAFSLMLIGSLAHGGLALANSVATILEMLGLLVLLRGRIGGVAGRQLGRGVGQSLVAAALMGLAVLGYLHLAGGRGVIVTAGGGIVLGALAYGVVSLLLGAAEMREVWRRGITRITGR